MPYADPDDDTEVEASGSCRYCGQPLDHSLSQ